MSDVKASVPVRVLSEEPPVLVVPAGPDRRGEAGGVGGGVAGLQLGVVSEDPGHVVEPLARST